MPTNNETQPDPFATPWHKESYDRFLKDTLPTLLAARLPLAGYSVQPTGEHTCRIAFAVTPADARPGFEIAYEEIPAIAPSGTFTIEALRGTGEGAYRVVPPIASSEDLAVADVRCVGEQLAAEFAAYLAKLPADLLSLLTMRTEPIPDEERTPEEIRTRTAMNRILWEPTDIANALRAWLPLSDWFLDFFTGQTVLNDGTWKTSRAQMVDPTNWLASQTHLRRILLEGEITGFQPSQIGRACFVETAEGPNVGRVLTVSRGATIEEGRIVPHDPRPEGVLGLAASCIPLIEHSSDARLLMGANMMRQWHQPPAGHGEPALVQTGWEPSPEIAPDFWCGRNLLTAFISWGVDTHEDALVLSESAAQRFFYPHPLEPGDKLSHRHGAKGVVSRILPDAEMPHLADGTPVDIVYAFTSLPSRINHGQVLEAVCGRVAKAEGNPFLAPSFASPDIAEIKQRLEGAGLDPSGQETLYAGKGGDPLPHKSTVGWVYWGRTAHDALGKLQVIGDDGTARGQLLGPREYSLLRQAGALHTIHALFNRQAQRPADATGRPERFQDLIARLQSAGITLSVADKGLTVRLGSSEDSETLTLAAPVSHPWLPGVQIASVASRSNDPAFAAVRKANARLVRLAEAGGSSLPESLRREAQDALEIAVAAYVADLLTPAALQMQERARFSGRTVVAPGADLRIEQMGLPDEMAWTLFGPQLLQEGKLDAGALKARTPEAAALLDARLATSWVLVNRRPSLEPTTLLALQPIRQPVGEKVVRLHPFHCPLLEADFDGDQLAVYLPLTPEAQAEMGERLTPRAHLIRNRELLKQNRLHAALWGLAERSRKPEGRAEIEQLLGVPLHTPMGFFDKSSMDAALLAIYDRDGVDKAIDVLEQLYTHGFALAKASGASFAPFIGESLKLNGTLPPAPAEDTSASAWDTWRDTVIEQLAARSARGQFDDDDLGVILLACMSGARGNLRLLARYIACTGSVDGSHSSLVNGKYLIVGMPDVVRHSLLDGLTLEESLSTMAGYRRALKRMMAEFTELEEADRVTEGPANPAAEGFHLLARALHASHPGRVFALAAQAGETDPLTGTDSRLFVGLPPQP